MSHTGSHEAYLMREGYVALDGDENVRRLREHQAFLVGLGIPSEVASTLDHIGVQTTSTPAFERMLEIYKEGARGATVHVRGDRRIAFIDRGEGLYRVELFEPRAGQQANPGFVHFAFIWPDWKPHEGELRDMAEVRRTIDLNGNWIAFLATPDGYEAEFVSEPVKLD